MKYRTVIVKVASHVGVPGNELADTLAKRGVLSRSSIGRFSSTPPQSLTPPSIDFNHSLWTEKTTTEQDTILTDLLTNNLPLISLLPQSAKKPWISPSTLKQIDHFQKATFADIAELKQARKRIKKSARRDKKDFIANNLLSDFHGSSVQQWTHTRHIRSDFKPRSAGLFNDKGKLVSSSQRARTFADYLANKIWHSSQDPPVPVSSPQPTLAAVDSPFTMQDLDNALRKLKPRKAPGPNDIPGEIYKHAPFVLKLYLLDHYNQCYSECSIPDTWLFFRSRYASQEPPKRYPFSLQLSPHLPYERFLQNFCLNVTKPTRTLC